MPCRVGFLPSDQVFLRPALQRAGQTELGLWSVVCGLWSVVCGLWSVVCGLWSVVCGLWSVVCGLWSATGHTNGQKGTVTPVGDGAYKLAKAKSGKAADGSGGSNADGVTGDTAMETTSSDGSPFSLYPFTA
ncbi:hypothetical protein FEM03_21550 [Phragmitibacter flavus]|uniref:Uncharacterized protein n=1 Tax=Phragmitibacter flavus TaxID=2576071 RepID=A0A5R8K8L2_9BACT|nr:hypothetical protein FEM03_21550 [Phragmitibacter flavus]